MSWNQFLQNNNTDYRGEKGNFPTIVKMTGVIFIGIVFLILIAYFFIHNSELGRATEAARKNIKNAQVSQLKVSGGFAIATVIDPAADGQAAAGSTIVFKVNKDGSMTQIAIGSSFSPVDLFGFGIPFETQTKLTSVSKSQMQQSLAGSCNYNGTYIPGYHGFDGSFNPDGWEIDSGTLSNIEQALTTIISDKNVKLNPEKRIVCINAIQNKGNVTTDSRTYISTFTLEVQFITNSGSFTTHVLTFSTGPHYYHSYALDGKKI